MGEVSARGTSGKSANFYPTRTQVLCLWRLLSRPFSQPGRGRSGPSRRCRIKHAWRSPQKRQWNTHEPPKGGFQTLWNSAGLCFPAQDQGHSIGPEDSETSRPQGTSGWQGTSRWQLCGSILVTSVSEKEPKRLSKPQCMTQWAERKLVFIWFLFCFCFSSTRNGIPQGVTMSYIPRPF